MNWDTEAFFLTYKLQLPTNTMNVIVVTYETE